MRRVVLIAVFLLACAAPAHAGLPFHAGQPMLPDTRTPQRLLDYRHALVGLDPARGPGAAFAMQQAGGRLIDPQLNLWSVPSHEASQMLPGLRAAGLVRSVTPDYPLKPLRAAASTSFCTDYLCPQEWWIHAVGADVWTPPGPGVPITMIDSGVDLNHPEFFGRPDTTALNNQTISATEDELHGTATASVAAAPANAGSSQANPSLEGIYPQAKLQIWDASPNGVLTVGGEIDGLAAAMRHGRGVINLSLGGFDRIGIEEHAILSAFASGMLIVASAGNDREEGSPRSYPASFAHVLTIGATDESNRYTYFSSSSPDMDLAAPGQDIIVAVPKIWDTTGYETLDGTSFSAPLVSGASAAVWTVRPSLTNTQLFEVMRRSAHQVSGRGWNRNTGFGILDVNAALTRKAPAADPQEPNEDIYLVKPNGLFRLGHARIRGALAAHLEQGDDPEDVYRAYLPAHRRLVVTVRPSANVNLEVWGPQTRTVFERGAAARRDLLGLSAHRGTRTERVIVHGGGSGQWVYVDAFLAKGVRDAAYTVSVNARP
ncbi:MAG TPA: S8 family serine peptidase [Gaiellaceae bacterium]